MFQLLRNPKKFDSERYKYWAGIYFQVCLAVFPTNDAIVYNKIKISATC